jgi:hypothetical protein
VRLSLAAAVVLAGTACAAVTLRAAEGAATASSCAGPRWDVRNLMDDAAARVYLTPLPSSVRSLARLARPDVVGAHTARLAPSELRTFRLRVRVVQARKDPSGDTVLVVRDLDGAATMLVAFADTHACPDLTLGRYANDVHAASDSFQADCGFVFSRAWIPLQGTATVSGVGYFAPGAASAHAPPNGLQLHPGLHFRSFDCRRR